MSKRLERMRDNPAANWTIGDIEAVCHEFGIFCEPPAAVARTTRSPIPASPKS